MEASEVDGVVRAGPAARERFYDARGYGWPDEGDLVLAPVEAAHLLYRGDLTAVDGRGFRSFLSSAAVSAVALQVYMDLRDRGFYLSPLSLPRPSDWPSNVVDFEVYPRGSGPWDDETAYLVRSVSERDAVPSSVVDALASLQTEAGSGPPGLLAIVDEESELTYFGCDRHRPTGTTDHALPTNLEATLLHERVLVPDPPPVLHERAFFGQRFGAGEGDLHLSLVEGAHLAARDVLSIDAGGAGLLERGRDVEGDRFDRRLTVYDALRAAGVVPKTGFKFGADFRTYASVETIDDLGHSELLVRVLPADHVFEPRDLALDVRLAHGVRKRMVFALADDADVADWLAVDRVTP